MSNNGDLATGLEVVQNIAKAVQISQAHDRSLIEYTKPVRVEPLTLIDMRASQLPYINELLHTVLNIFTGYYSLAINLSVGVQGVNVKRLFDQFNPQRDFRRTGVLLKEELDERYRSESREPSTQSVLDAGEIAEIYSSLENRQALVFPGQSYSAERDSDFTEIAKGSENNVRGVDAPKSLKESENLAVGKLLEITVGKGKDADGVFQILARLRSQEMRSNLLVDTMSMDQGRDDSLWQQFKERWHGWRSGELRLVRDIMLAQDLIEKHRKNLMEDTTGYYQSQRKEDRRHFWSSLLTRDPSVAGASSIFVMTSETARELERKMRGSLDRYSDREKLFSRTRGMLLVVVDQDWEQVTIYHRSIKDPTEVTVSEIKRLNKKGGPDIMEILQAFRQSRTPSI